MHAAGYTIAALHPSAYRDADYRCKATTITRGAILASSVEKARHRHVRQHSQAPGVATIRDRSPDSRAIQQPRDIRKQITAQTSFQKCREDLYATVL
jgi:hypothetical protein